MDHHIDICNADSGGFISPPNPLGHFICCQFVRHSTLRRLPKALPKRNGECFFLFAVVALTVTKAVASVLPFVRDGVRVCVCVDHRVLHRAVVNCTLIDL